MTTKMVSMRLTDSTKDKINELAEIFGVSQAQIIKRAIAQYYEHCKKAANKKEEKRYYDER